MQSGFTSKECKFKKEAEQAPPANDTPKLRAGLEDLKANESQKVRMLKMLKRCQYASIFCVPVES